jgi:hypothetical protein
MAIIGTYCLKAGLDTTAVALLTALGLHLRGRDVDFVQLSTHVLNFSFDPSAELPFGYKTLPWEGGRSYQAVLETIDQARADGRDVVLDMPPVPLVGRTALYQRLSPVLIPTRPGSAYLNLACLTWETVRVSLERGETPGPMPWLLPFEWTTPARALWQIRGMLEARAAGGFDTEPAARLVPWNVPRLLPEVMGALFDPDTIEHTPALRPVADALAGIALRLAEDPGGTFETESDLFGGPKGGAPGSPGDPRDISQRYWELAEDLAIIRAGQGPSQAELDAAPVLQDWYLEPEVGLVLVGRVEGHPVLDPKWIRTSQLHHYDELRSFARTLSRYYRLGRRRDEGEQ